MLLFDTADVHTTRTVTMSLPDSTHTRLQKFSMPATFAFYARNATQFTIYRPFRSTDFPTLPFDREHREDSPELVHCIHRLESRSSVRRSGPRVVADVMPDVLGFSRGVLRTVL